MALVVVAPKISPRFSSRLELSSLQLRTSCYWVCWKAGVNCTLSLGGAAQLLSILCITIISVFICFKLRERDSEIDILMISNLLIFISGWSVEELNFIPTNDHLCLTELFADLAKLMKAKVKK